MQIFKSAVGSERLAFILKKLIFCGQPSHVNIEERFHSQLTFFSGQTSKMVLGKVRILEKLLFWFFKVLSGDKPDRNRFRVPQPPPILPVMMPILNASLPTDFFPI